MATTPFDCGIHLLQNVQAATAVSVDNSTAAAVAPPPPPPSPRGRPRVNTTLSLSTPSSNKRGRPRETNPTTFAAPPPDDGDRCKRNGSGGWRCPFPRIPGNIFCDKHHQYKLKQKERVRAAKKGVTSPAPAPAIPPVVEAAAPTPCPFQVGEIWALPDIPGWEARFYARIERIIPCTGTGRVELTHLVPDSEEPGRVLACSTFHIIPDQPTTVKPITCLSHRAVSSEAAAGKSSFEIFPNAGEVWAVYDSLEPDAAYHLVEIVSGFTEDNGVTVAPLVPAERVGFSREMNGQQELRRTYFKKDLLWFSHQVPAVPTEEEDAGPGVGLWQVLS